MRRVGGFLFLWLMVGFTLGTAVLLGPVRWITTATRRDGWGQVAENTLVAFVIIAYVLMSALIAAWLAWVVRRTKLRHVAVGVPLLATVSAAAALWLWMTPAALGATLGSEQYAGAQFTFGPYPTADKMRELKAGGYTAVVSLLHPAVIPFEPTLLADERRTAAEAGLTLIHAPMLPWVSDNEESLARIEKLARDDEGRYYVHCYLGKDRVQLVRRMIEEVRGRDSTVDGVRARSLYDVEKFERGELFELEDGVFLAPYPTDEEFMGYVLGGQVSRVVSLLDPAQEHHRRWIEKERALLKEYQLAYTSLPISRDSYDPRQVLTAARAVRQMERPVLVHDFLSLSTGRSEVGEAFLQAYRSDLPPLPPTRFREPLSSGAVTVVAPNIATGPRPAGAEFGSYLERGGVRQFVYLGDAEDDEAVHDARVANDHAIRWTAVDPHDGDLWEMLAGGGPWYLYGPGLEEVQTRLASRFGPALPEATREGLGEPSGFWERAIPSPRRVVLFGPMLLLVVVAAGGAVGSLRRRGMAAPYTRKIFHFVIFTLAGVLHLTAGLSAVMLFGGITACVVLYAVWRGDGFPLYEAMARPTDAPRRTLFILVPLATTAVGGLLVNIFFAPFAYVGYLVGGWGDAIGEPVGAAWGRHRYRVPSLAGVVATRSLEGSTAVLLVGALAAFLGLWAFGIHPGTAAGVALACGLTGAVVEAFSNHGLDNLTIQLAAAATAFLLLG